MRSTARQGPRPLTRLLGSSTPTLGRSPDNRCCAHGLARSLDRANGWLDMGRKRPIPHESHFMVAGYFCYYGHYYATLCVCSTLQRPFYQDHWPDPTGTPGIANVVVGLSSLQLPRSSSTVRPSSMHVTGELSQASRPTRRSEIAPGRHPEHGPADRVAGDGCRRTLRFCAGRRTAWAGCRAPPPR